MSRFAVGVLVITSLTLPLAPRTSGVRAEEPKKPLVPTIKEIMQEAHQCRTSYIREVRTEIDRDEPNWDLIGLKSRELVRAGKLLSLNTPPRGTAESWEKQTSLYIARATVLSEAAERKDKEEGRVISRRMHAMCAGCHREHK